jgi:hypothetical protein
MRFTDCVSPKNLVLAVALGIATVGCTGGGSSSGGGGGAGGASSTDDFAVQSISVVTGAIWEVNRPIDITFTQDLDFATVSLNTITIASASGLPATGTFTQLGPRTVRFQPTCPTQADSSDAGLVPGSQPYSLVVLGSLSSAGVTVLSMAGDHIETSLAVDFTTPPLGGDIFVDTQPGPPLAIVRGKDGVSITETNATYLEVGGDPMNRIYFEWDPMLQQGVLPPGTLVPINHYSVLASQVSVIVHINQAVDPAASNINQNRATLSYKNSAGLWNDVGTRISLDENCTESGAAIRLAPQGILPQGSELRVDLSEGFSDLAGNATFIDTVNFANMVSDISFDPGTMTPGTDGDEILETFSTSGDDPDSLEDSAAAFLTPQADWGGGRLVAAFDFEGTGGSGGNFDWRVPAGQTFILDTTSASITGGPNFQATTIQAVINGVVDVRNMDVPADAVLVIQGPNPCTILASGTVSIEGRIEINGTSSRGVGTLNTANLPEPGASGQGGGGGGGTASFLATQSTPRGGTGFGAFNVNSGGGQGGETSYGAGGSAARRGAGGGGGNHGPDIFYRWSGDPGGNLVFCQELIGYDGERGFAGGATGTSAVTDNPRALGGALGPAPFLDLQEDNNFFGTLLTAGGELIRGELMQVWAGAGGGAGGDSVSGSTFPLANFTANGDEKGSGGGGGAGGLSIFAIGTITIVATPGGDVGGQVIAEGGQGGGGENTNFLDRVGGGSGAGAGGHIVLSSASQVIVGGAAAGSLEFYNEDPTASGNFSHNQRAISALGGQGGAGHDDRGGSGSNGVPTSWRCDAIPRDHFGLNYDPIVCHPPSNAIGNPPTACNYGCAFPAPDSNDQIFGPVYGAGGDGAPGQVQVHVDDPANNFLFPDIGGMYGIAGAGYADVSRAIAPPPVGWQYPEFVGPTLSGVAADVLVPFFGKDSTSQSKWIALGRPEVNPDGMGGFNGPDSVVFAFSGTNPVDGEVMRTGVEVMLEAPMVGPDTLGPMGVTPFIDEATSELTMVVDAAGLADDIYKRNPSLTRMFTVRLLDAAMVERDFTVVDATYDIALDNLHLTVAPDSDGDSLVDFRDDVTTTAPIMVSLIPRAFMMETVGIPDFFPTDTAVTITFDATMADVDGLPDETQAFSGGTPPVGFASDITDLNILAWDFFRFRVEFDLNTAGGGIDITTPRPSLRFVRVPYRF